MYTHVRAVEIRDFSSGAVDVIAHLLPVATAPQKKSGTSTSRSKICKTFNIPRIPKK
jgi:hypothetical protein